MTARAPGDDGPAWTRPPPRFEHRRVVSFHETDAAGIVHFASYFPWMEDCEHAFLRSLGLSVHVDRPGGGFRGFPRVHVEADYRSPLAFEDEVVVGLYVASVGRRSITYRYTLRHGATGRLAAVGRTTVVCAGRETGEGPLTSQDLPPVLAEAAAQALAATEDGG